MFTGEIGFIALVEHVDLRHPPLTGRQRADDAEGPALLSEGKTVITPNPQAFDDGGVGGVIRLGK